MKIYMVIGDNLESAYENYKEWNEAAFASKKSAEDYIRKLTDDENAEYEKLIRNGDYDQGIYYHINYRIVEFDVHE